MRVQRFAAALLPLALAACGGPSASQFQDAAPSYGALAMDVTAAATTGGATSMAAEPAPAELMATTVPSVDTCHPHLFLRTADVALRVNRHLWKFLRHVEALSDSRPDDLTSGSATWDRVRGTLEVRWTVTKVSDVLFQWLLQVRPVGGSAWTTIFSGQIDRTGATGPHQGTGTATLDLTALHSVDPLEPATGTIDAAFETFSDHRKLVVDARAVSWDPMGLTFVVSGPLDAHYVYYRAPGKGGSFKAHDSMVFACPIPAVAPPPPADVKMLTRWTVTGGATPAYHGRSDAVMAGGQITAGDRVVGLTCQTAAFDATPTVEAYWLMKEEDGSAGNATVAGQAWGPVGSSSACDAALNPPTGNITSVSDPGTDYDFSAVDFDSAAPGPFPGGP